MEFPKGTFVVGNGLYMQCRYCEKIVRINKLFFGSMHICLTEEEQKVKDSQTLFPGGQAKR